MRTRLIAFLLGIACIANAQTSPYVKFGKITVEELQKKYYAIDSSASAVVLSDIASKAIEGNTKGWFSVVNKYHRVVHILNKNGYFEADVEVPLYHDNENEEKMDNLKAVTYNLENGKIVETKLDRGAVVVEKASKNRTTKKFTFPNVKEGCIIEYEYTVVSDYISNLDPWYFQGRSPVLWSECLVSLPEFYMYSFLGHGYHPFAISDRKDKQMNFTVMETRSAGATERVTFTAGVSDYRWVMQNVPELKREHYTSAVRNHIANIEFQLIAQRHPLPPHEYRTNWANITKELSTSEGFGANLNSANNWLADDIRPVIAGANTPLEKAVNIYNYVKDNFTCTDHQAVWASQSLKNTMKTTKGSVSEINLLLTAMLRYAGLNAAPVILSTTDHGYVSEAFPTLTNFNYVVSKVTIGDRDYFLDGSRSKLAFGKMLPECFNGHARVIDDAVSSVNFSADSLNEKKITTVFVTNNDKGEWIGAYKQVYGDYESYTVRDEISEKGQDAFFTKKQKELPDGIKLTAQGLDSLRFYQMPVNFHADMNFEPNTDDLIYINPLFGEATTENPFQAAQRFYPVEMPFRMDETFILNLEVPKGYEVDELPKQVVAKLDENNSAYFEYRLSQSGNLISLRSRILVNRTLFLPDEYATLRDFFALVVKKQNEQIVFKKKK